MSVTFDFCGQMSNLARAARRHRLCHQADHREIFLVEIPVHSQCADQIAAVSLFHGHGISRIADPCAVQLHLPLSSLSSRSS
jgi:hypothetical protein